MARTAKQRTIRVVRLPLQGRPHVARIENTLEAEQAEVGGLIEPIQLPYEGLDLYLNGEGLLEDLPINPWVTEIWRVVNGGPGERANDGCGYRGPGFVARLNLNSGDLVDLTDADIFWLQGFVGKIGSEEEAKEEEARDEPRRSAFA